MRCYFPLIQISKCQSLDLISNLFFDRLGLKDLLYQFDAYRAIGVRVACLCEYLMYRLGQDATKHTRKIEALTLF